MKFVATKKGLTKKNFSPLPLVEVFGSGIQDPGWVKIRIRDPEWVKIRIPDKHPGFTTLSKCFHRKSKKAHLQKVLIWILRPLKK